MKPARYSLTAAGDLDCEFIQRLWAEFAAQGSPPISCTPAGAMVTFESETGEVMLCARMADALAEVTGDRDWQALFRPIG